MSPAERRSRHRPETIAGAVLARADDPRLGLVAGDLRLSHAEVVAARGPAGGLAAGRRAPTAPSTWPSCSTTCPSSSSGSRRPRWPVAVVVGANPTHRGDELVRDLTHTECQFLVTDSTYLPLVEGLRPRCGASATVAADNPRVLVLDTAAGARRALGAHAGARPARRGRADVTPGVPRLPALHLGHLGRAQGVPVQPGPPGPHRRHRGPDVRARPPTTCATSPCRSSTPTR